MKSQYLFLDDETPETVSQSDMDEREKIIQWLFSFDETFFSRLRHLQPIVGCLNRCGFCSQEAETVNYFWNVNRIKNVVFAIKNVVNARFRQKKPLLAWGRSEHRSGIIYAYLDNDIGYYPYLYEFIYYMYHELGVKVRISTIGFSRFNSSLVDMHKKISTELEKALGGVRLSISPYAIGYHDTAITSRESYVQDVAAFLNCYRNYYDTCGSGYRKMCVEFRFPPLIQSGEVHIFSVNKNFCIECNGYILVSKDKSVHFEEAFVIDAYNHEIELSREGLLFDYYFNSSKIGFAEIRETIEKGLENKVFAKIYESVKVYKFSNDEGEYYSAWPQIDSEGCYGIQFYPKTSNRDKSGILITERFFLNALVHFKKTRKLSLSDKIKPATWDDVESVLSTLKNIADTYERIGDKLKSEYIVRFVLSIYRDFMQALKTANYPPEVFFDDGFTIDTGCICNIGRGINEFRAITDKKNLPLTPTHERNYGNKISTMTVEGIVYRLSCGKKNDILAQRSNLNNVATIKGQREYVDILKLSKMNDTYCLESLQKIHLIPGQIE